MQGSFPVTRVLAPSVVQLQHVCNLPGSCAVCHLSELCNLTTVTSSTKPRARCLPIRLHLTVTIVLLKSWSQRSDLFLDLVVGSLNSSSTDTWFFRCVDDDSFVRSAVSDHVLTTFYWSLMMINRILSVNLIVSSVTCSVYGFPPFTTMTEKTAPTGIQTVQDCLRMQRVCRPRQAKVIHTHLGFFLVWVNPWSVRVIHCLTLDAVITPWPEWEMRELMCVVLSFAHVDWIFSFLDTSFFASLPLPLPLTSLPLPLPLLSLPLPLLFGFAPNCIGIGWLSMYCCVRVISRISSHICVQLVIMTLFRMRCSLTRMSSVMPILMSSSTVVLDWFS